MAEAPHGAQWTLPQFKRTYPHLSVNFWYWDIAGGPRGHNACSVIITGLRYTVKFGRAVQLIKCDSHAHLVSKAGLHILIRTGDPANSLYLCSVEERKSYRFETMMNDPLIVKIRSVCTAQQTTNWFNRSVTRVNNCMISGLHCVGIAVPLKHTAVLHFGLF